MWKMFRWNLRIFQKTSFGCIQVYLKKRSVGLDFGFALYLLRKSYHDKSQFEMENLAFWVLFSKWLFWALRKTDKQEMQLFDRRYHTDGLKGEIMNHWNWSISIFVRRQFWSNVGFFNSGSRIVPCCLKRPVVLRISLLTAILFQSNIRSLWFIFPEMNSFQNFYWVPSW